MNFEQFSSSSSTEEEDANPNTLCRVRNREIRSNGSVLDMPTQEFRRNFRMDKECFLQILNEVSPKYSPTSRSTAIPPIIKLATFLRFAATGNYQTGVGNENASSMSQASVSRIIWEHLNIFEEDLATKWIRLEMTAEEELQIKQTYFERFGIPGVIGCVDGTHIKIMSPAHDQKHLYYNRKGYYSINALMINGSTSGTFAYNCSNKIVVSDSLNDRHVNKANETCSVVLSDSDGACSGINANASFIDQISAVSSKCAEASCQPEAGNAYEIFNDLKKDITRQSALVQQSTQPIQHQSVSSELLRKSKSQDKIDGSFSRSRSSSMSSIDISSSESVTCLAIIESVSRRNDIPLILPTLWIGTSFGSILTVLITMPDKDVRKSQPVLITINGGPIIRLKGSITSLSFLNGLGFVVPCSFELWKDVSDCKEGNKERTPSKSISRSSPTFTASTTISGQSVGFGSRMSGENNTALDTLSERQYVVVVSEKQTNVFDVTSQTFVNKISITDVDFVVKAETVSMKDGSCLAAYLSNGHVIVYSLPSLRLLLHAEFLPLMDLSFQTKCKQGIVDPMLSIWGQQLIVNEDTNQISKIFCFSNKGHGLYLASPTEIQKFSISSEFCHFLPEMMAELFIPHVMPEQPKEGFLKGLFGGGPKNLNREELFGVQSGKSNRSVAKYIPGANINQLGQRASSASSEITRAHQLVLERGEKLNMLEEKAERMANQAQDFSGTAHQLMLKYKDKKWYQL